MKINCWYYRYGRYKYKIKKENYLSYLESLDRLVDRVIVDFPLAVKKTMDAITNQDN